MSAYGAMQISSHRRATQRKVCAGMCRRTSRNATAIINLRPALDCLCRKWYQQQFGCIVLLPSPVVKLMPAPARRQRGGGRGQLWQPGAARRLVLVPAAAPERRCVNSALANHLRSCSVFEPVTIGLIFLLGVVAVSGHAFAHPWQLATRRRCGEHRGCFQELSRGNVGLGSAPCCCVLGPHRVAPSRMQC